MSDTTTTTEATIEEQIAENFMIKWTRSRMDAAINDVEDNAISLLREMERAITDYGLQVNSAVDNDSVHAVSPAEYLVSLTEWILVYRNNLIASIAEVKAFEEQINLAESVARDILDPRR